MVEYNRKIDVIIPAYNVPDKTLSRCLASIACQEIVDELEVTIVDDASTEENYTEVVKIFSPLMKINLLRYETNGGPGVARQYGIDHTFNEYITFIDADDTFHGAFALKLLRICLESGENNIMCTSFFEQESNNNDMIDFIPHDNDLVWMFGKLYRRNFIMQNNIRFHPTSRANEDSGFNRLCQLYAIDQQKMIFECRFPTYFWHINENSITRINDCEYTFGGYEKGSNYGYMENMIYVIETAKDHNIHESIINDFAIECLSAMYHSYIDTLQYAPQYSDYNFTLCKNFYNLIYKTIDMDNKDEILITNNIGYFDNSLSYTIHTFLRDLRKE